MKASNNIFLWTRHTDSWCNMLQTLERRRKFIRVILSDEHTLNVYVFNSRYYQNIAESTVSNKVPRIIK